MFNENASKKKTAVIITVVFAILLTAAIVFFDVFSSEKYSEQSGFAMGSQIQLQLYGDENEAVFDEIIANIQDEEINRISRYKAQSEIYRLNEQKTFTVSDSTAEMIRKALEIAEKSQGAFDITVGELSALWDFDSGENKVPADDDIESVLSFTGYEELELEGNKVTLGENQTLDMGALGKGYACDIALDVLEKHEVSSAIVSVGGTVLVYGEKKRNIGIRTPEKDEFSSFMKVAVEGVSFVSTSGRYEKSFEADGRLYHHILDPETGYPAENELKSVTVISDNGLLSDALSTACFVIGIEGSAQLLEYYGAQAIFVDNENNVYITDGIIDKCTLLSDAYKVHGYE